MQRLARLLCVLAAFSVVGGPLWVGQSVAWLSMLGERIPVLGLRAAVADTFSGANPCEICRAVQSERERQKDEAPVPERSPLAKGALQASTGRPLALFPPATGKRNPPASLLREALWDPERPARPPWA